MRWMHTTPYTQTGTSGDTPFRGRRSAVASSPQKIRGLSFWLDTATAVNGVWICNMDYQIVPASVPVAAGVWEFPFYWAMRMNKANPFPGTIAGENLQGIQVGSMSVDTPWQTTYATDPSTGAPVGQLRFNFTTGKLQMMAWDADAGVAPIVQDCAIQPAWDVDLLFREFALAWDPVTKKLTGYIDRTLIHTLDLSARSMTGGTFGPGFFWTNGSGAGRACNEAGYYVGTWWHPLPVHAI